MAEEVVDSPSVRDEPLVRKMKKRQMLPASVKQMQSKLKGDVLVKDDSLSARTTPVQCGNTNPALQELPVMVVKGGFKGKEDEPVNIGGTPDISDTKMEAVEAMVASRQGAEKASKVKCEECGSLCLKGNLRRHIRMLHGDKKDRPYICPVRRMICPEKGCSMNFNKIEVLKNHIKRCHSANDEILENCSDSRQELDTMNTIEGPLHHPDHNVSDNKQSGRGLNTSGIARNGKAALYQCNIEGCDRIYVNRQSLIRHHRIDHESKLSPTLQLDPAMLNFKCKVPLCGAVFLKKGYLAEHSKRDHSKGVMAKSKHVKEEVVVNSKATFPCGMPKCDKVFISKGNLARHIKEVHEGNRRSVEVEKKVKENTFVFAEEIDIDIEDVRNDNDKNHEQEGGLDDNGTMEVVLDTTKLYEAGAREVEIKSGEENVEHQVEVDNIDSSVNNNDSMQEIKNGEAAVERFEVDPLRVGRQLEDEIY